jgi:hypothetical protein
MIGGDSSAPLVCATVPGAPLALRALAEACVTALERVGRGGVDVTFGLDQPPGASCLPGWLASIGWRGELTANLITDEVTAWLLREGMGASGA